MRRRPAKIDANQPAIVEKLRKLGVGVLVLNGVVDLIVGWQGRNFLFEIKNPDSSHPKTQPAQRKLRASWPGQYAVVKTVDEALAVMGYGD